MIEKTHKSLNTDDFLVAHEDPQSGGGAGIAAERHVRALSSDLSSPVRLIAPNPLVIVNPTDTANINYAGFPLPKEMRGIPKEQLLDWLKTDERTREFFEKVLRESGESIVANYWVAGDLALEVLGPQRDRRVILMNHSAFPEVAGEWVQNPNTLSKISSRRKEIEESLLNTADAIVVATSAEQSALIRLYPDRNLEGRVFVVSHAVDETRWNPEIASRLRTENRSQYFPEADENTTIFYTLSRLVPGKGIEETVRAVNLLVEKYGQNDFMLAVCGGPLEGEYYKQLQEIYESEIKPEAKLKIKFLGPLPGDIPPAIADVLVYPSDIETFGLVPLEAMKMGRPAIVSNVPTLVEVAGNGAAITNRTVEGVASAMDAMFNRSYRQERAEAALERSKDYTWEKSSKDMRRVINTVKSMPLNLANR